MNLLTSAVICTVETQMPEHTAYLLPALCVTEEPSQLLRQPAL